MLTLPAARAASALLCPSPSTPNSFRILLQGLAASSCLLPVRDVATTMSAAPPPPHVKCRHPNQYLYKDSDGEHKVARLEVPVEQIPWSSAFDSYAPPNFTAKFVLSAAWADPQLGADGFQPKWNQVDGAVNRKSHEGEYKITGDNEPLNIRGRTGLKGRGVLGKWGPNHAADPVVTRWKRDESGQTVTREGKPALEAVVIQRRDTGCWALPGGMVDPGEKVSATVRREFMEEAMDSTTASKEQQQKMAEQIKGFFDKGQEIYSGYVDDPRNTDNAWMETVAFLFHDGDGGDVGSFQLKAGDDAKALKWLEINNGCDLYASHKDIIRKAVEMLGANW